MVKTNFTGATNNLNLKEIRTDIERMPKINYPKEEEEGGYAPSPSRPARSIERASAIRRTPSLEPVGKIYLEPGQRLPPAASALPRSRSPAWRRSRAGPRRRRREPAKRAVEGIGPSITLTAVGCRRARRGRSRRALPAGAEGELRSPDHSLLHLRRDSLRRAPARFRPLCGPSFRSLGRSIEASGRKAKATRPLECLVETAPAGKNSGPGGLTL